MADNAYGGSQDTANPLIATDDVAGVHYQKVKLVVGTAESTDVLPSHATDGLKVNLGADNDVTVTGSVTADLGVNNDVTVTGTVTANLAAGVNNIGDVDVLSIAAGTNNIGDVDVLTIAAGDNNIGNVDIVTMPNVVIGSGTVTTVSTVTAVTSITNPVTVSSHAVTNAGTFAVQPSLGATGTVTSVNDTNVSTTLLASGATRKGFRIYNDSTVTLYVKYGTTASSTDFTALLIAGAYLEENFYSGRVDGIWASDASGAARITELT